jgi:8-oxo-dGTP diphosphatase
LCYDYPNIIEKAGVMETKRPSVTVDCILFDEHDRLLLVRRKLPPFEGSYALPGGFVDIGETVEEATLRELKEETNLDGAALHLVGVYSDPKRDPRRHTITVAFLALSNSGVVMAGDDAASAEFVANWREVPLAFDHKKIVDDAVTLKSKL